MQKGKLEIQNGGRKISTKFTFTKYSSGGILKCRKKEWSIAILKGWCVCFRILDNKYSHCLVEINGFPEVDVLNSNLEFESWVVWQLAENFMEALYKVFDS